MVVNDGNTHELNRNYAVSFLRNMSRCNVASDAVITQKNIDEMVNHRVQNALLALHASASFIKKGRSNSNNSKKCVGNKKKLKNPQAENSGRYEKRIDGGKLTHCSWDYGSHIVTRGQKDCPYPTWITNVREGIIGKSNDDDDAGKEKNVDDEKAPFFSQGSKKSNSNGQ